MLCYQHALSADFFIMTMFALLKINVYPIIFVLAYCNTCIV